MNNSINIRRKAAAVLLMAAMFIGCAVLLGSGAYAETLAPGKVGKLKWTSGYESVYLTWKAPKSGAAGYEIRQGKTPVAATKKTECKVPCDPFPANTKGNARKYTFAVYAYNLAEDGQTKIYSEEPAVVEEVTPIHPMYVVVQTRYTTNLYPSATSNKVARSVKGGTKLVSFGGARQNGGNKRVVLKYKGKVYYARSGDVNILKMKYNFKQPYSKKHVEGFINDGIDNGKKLTSNPKMHGKKLIWVNTYNQRVYLFTWDKADKKWVISSRYPKGLPCNTGKELTPYGIFHVTSKWDVKESTGTRWWCIFNSVGIHEKLGDALGHPASGGCVRIPDADARWFYFNVGKMTTVLVY